jgi:predicted ATPase/DNA-binding CsgD family transcriptional regulator
VARIERTRVTHHPGIPALPAPLVGRHAEIAAACDLVTRGARLLTLTGPPGVGKTSLALAVAAELYGQFSDGAFMVDLSAVTDANVVAATLADVLGLGGRRQPVGRLIGMLRRREMLLLLDNFEQVVAAAPVVSELLVECPALTVLVTSRVPLRLRWEHELPVPPLALPDADASQTVDRLSRVPAVRLFVDRAQAVSPVFALTDENAPDVAHICTRLDGLPLAIELAAARVRVFPPAALLAQLGGSGHGRNAGPGLALDLLRHGARDLPIRQQTLRDAITWSYDLLAPAERQLLRRLAVFAGGCTAEAVKRVCEASWAEIAFLIENSLLRQAPVIAARDPGGSGPRYRMLETVRAYALEQLIASGEEPEIRRRHAAYYVELAEEAEPWLVGPSQTIWLARLDLEVENVRAVTRWAADAGDVETLLRLSAALIRFWHGREDPESARERVESIVALAAAAPPLPATIRALTGAGDVSRALGDHQTARSLFEQSLWMARQLGDPAETSAVLALLSRLAGQRGSHAEARRLGEESLMVFEASGDQTGLAAALHELGMTSYREGDQMQARRLLERGQAVARRLGDVRLTSTCTFGLALTCHVTGQLDQAEQLFDQCLTTARAQQNRMSEGSILNNVGHLAILRGDLGRARELLRESLLASREAGDRRRLAFTLSAVAGLFAVEGESERALRLDAAGHAALSVVGATLAAPMRTLYDEQIAPAKVALGTVGVRDAWAAGQTMTLDGAVDEALERLGDPIVPAGSPDQDAEADPAARSDERAASDSLTRREREVAGLIARGLTNRQIAEVLIVSERTAGNYVQRVLNRLNLNNRAQIAVWAVEHGLHEEPPAFDAAP